MVLETWPSWSKNHSYFEVDVTKVEEIIISDLLTTFALGLLFSNVVEALGGITYVSDENDQKVISPVLASWLEPTAYGSGTLDR
jgi:hypothetical protein